MNLTAATVVTVTRTIDDDGDATTSRTTRQVLGWYAPADPTAVSLDGGPLVSGKPGLYLREGETPPQQSDLIEIGSLTYAVDGDAADWGLGVHVPLKVWRQP